MLENTFAFCSIGVHQSYLLQKKARSAHVLTKALLPKAALLDWSVPGLSECGLLFSVPQNHRDLNLAIELALIHNPVV